MTLNDLPPNSHNTPGNHLRQSAATNKLKNLFFWIEKREKKKVEEKWRRFWRIASWRDFRACFKKKEKKIQELFYLFACLWGCPFKRNTSIHLIMGIHLFLSEQHWWTTDAAARKIAESALPAPKSTKRRQYSLCVGLLSVGIVCVLVMNSHPHISFLKADLFGIALCHSGCTCLKEYCALETGTRFTWRGLTQREQRRFYVRASFELYEGFCFVFLRVLSWTLP